jgi:hypothetical protein
MNTIITTVPVKKRIRRTDEQLATIDRQIADVLRLCWPQSVRHVFYRMTDTSLPVFVPKTDKGKNNGYGVIQRRLVKLRAKGIIPYRWVCDFTRRGYHVSTFKSAADFLRRMNSVYRAPIWEKADVYVEVWVESRSIAGIVQDLCEELGVSLYPSGGFASHSLIFDCAEYIKQQLEDGGKPIHIIYIGDYDPAGVLIDRKIEEQLRKHLGIGSELTFHRIGITAEQVAFYNLPTKPRKEGDKRSPEVKWTVEAEALPAEILLHLLREKIESFIPSGALQTAKVAEESEREWLISFAEALEGRE